MYSSSPEAQPASDTHIKVNKQIKTKHEHNFFSFSDLRIPKQFKAELFEENDRQAWGGGLKSCRSTTQKKSRQARLFDKRITLMTDKRFLISLKIRPQAY